MTITIRDFREDDRETVLSMAARFYETTSYTKVAPMCRNSVNGVVDILARDGVMLIAEVDGETVGMVGMIVIPFGFNASILAAYEVVWYVEPEHQSAGVGRALLAAVEPACKAKDCRMVQMMHMHDSPPQAGAAYVKIGYDPTEHSSTKAI